MVPAGPSNFCVTLGKSLHLFGLRIPHCQVKETALSMVPGSHWAGQKEEEN